MRIAVLSDIHANIEALDAVRRAAAEEGASASVCLGDVVGYGPDPVPCVEWAGTEPLAWVQGNHDRAVLPEERDFRRRFRGSAARALNWNEQVLTESALAHLRGLPFQATGPWGLALHANPDDLLTYVRTLHEGVSALFRARALGLPALPSASEISLLWLGHTHLPFALHEDPPAERGDRRVSEVEAAYGRALILESGAWLLNPGSVGQPRDGDPRARWALLDTSTPSVRFMATEYDYRVTQAKMVQAGLPRDLITLLGP